MRSAHLNRVGASGGARIGWLAKRSPSLEIIPTLGLELGLNGFSWADGVHDVARTSPIGTSDFGLGLIVRSRMSIAAGVRIPYSATVNTGVALGVTYGFLRH